MTIAKDVLVVEGFPDDFDDEVPDILSQYEHTAEVLSWLHAGPDGDFDTVSIQPPETKAQTKPQE